jgi:hypothetical protein
VIALGRGKISLAWLAAALALSTKLQGLSLVPLLLWATWRQQGMPGLAKLGRVHQVSSSLRPAGLPVTYRQIGVGLYGLFVLFVLAVVRRRRPEAPALPAAVLALGLFVLLTEVHERFMFPILALLLLAAGHAHAARPARLGWVYAALSLTFAFNLVSIAPFSPLPAMNLVAAQGDSPGLFALRALALGCAALNVALLAWLAVILAATNPRPQTRAAHLPRTHPGPIGP